MRFWPDFNHAQTFGVFGKAHPEAILTHSNASFHSMRFPSVRDRHLDYRAPYPEVHQIPDYDLVDGQQTACHGREELFGPQMGDRQESEIQIR